MFLNLRIDCAVVNELTAQIGPGQALPSAAWERRTRPPSGGRRATSLRTWAWRSGRSARTEHVVRCRRPTRPSDGPTSGVLVASSTGTRPDPATAAVYRA